MQIKILSVTSKKNTLFDDLFFQYKKRLPRHIQLDHIKIPMVKRSKTKPVKAAVLESTKKNLGKYL